MKKIEPNDYHLMCVRRVKRQRFPAKLLPASLCAIGQGIYAGVITRTFSCKISPSFAVCNWAGNKLWGHYLMSGDLSSPKHSCKHQCEFLVGSRFNFAEPSGRHANQGSRNFLFLSFNIDNMVECYINVIK